MSPRARLLRLFSLNPDQVEVEEALDKVLVTLKVFSKYRSAFREFKGKLPSYFHEDKKPKTWDFQEHLVFKRFDSFVDRLNIIKEFFKTAQQFLKLEKVEIGGIRGKALSSRINHVHEEFKVAFTRLYHGETLHHA